MDRKARAVATFLLVLTFFCWGSVYVGGRMIPQVPASLIAAMRCLIAAVPLLLMAKKHRGMAIAREDWKYFLLVGSLGYFMTILLIQEGISRIGASTASLINSMTPVGVTICAAIILKERITPIKVFCLVLALSGTWMITAGAAGAGQGLGILLALLSVCSWSLASVFMRKLTAKYPPILVTAYGMAVSLVFHIPVAIKTAVDAGGTGIDSKALLVLLYLGLVGSGLAQFTWTKCLSVIPASTCSLFYPLQPAFSAILGFLILKETFTPIFFVGMALIAADVVLCGWETKRLLSGTESALKR